MSQVESAADVIALYEEVVILTGRMLSAAQQRDWVELNRLERGCATCIARLAGCTAVPRLSGTIRRHKLSLLWRILDNHRQTQALADPLTQHLQTWTAAVGCRPRNSATPE